MDQTRSSELVMCGIIPVDLSTNSGPSPESLIQNIEKWSHRHVYRKTVTGDCDVHPWLRTSGLEHAFPGMVH